MTADARPPRADSIRNRALLLSAAEIEFAQRGSGTSIADIARRAGVAKGTVFRHFATKEELVTAVVGGHFRRLATAAQQRSDAEDPGAALWDFLAEAGEILRQQDLAFLQATGEGDATVAAVLDELRAAVEVLVERARADKAIRADVTGADVLMMLCAAVHTAGLQPNAASGLWRRYLVIVIDGLRPAGATPLPELMPS